ncbi:MAG: TetR/AcrR family transcriptional regulator [Gordonia sp. (in: high G+C Gram-positive bacteria)]
MRLTYQTRRTVNNTTRRSRSPRGSGELLAEEIIDAATQLLLDAQDAAAVSIRAVATKVGVTPPSIYLHFADKEALLDAVCARYFEQLDARLRAAVDGVDDPLERALRMGIAYVRFGVATPVLYRQAFHALPVDEQSKVDQVLAASAFVRFTEVITEVARAGLFPEDEVGTIVLELWSAAHGVASLMIAKPALWRSGDFTLAEEVLRSICIGRAVLGVGRGREPSGLPALLDSLRVASAAAIGQEKVKSELERVHPR